ncbi:hypothetical protein [Parashewanella spongiae]|uniref:hypothetical protein n=1 Tax=Parashewanella spongiae TaxID=342950 RepID=UPI0010592E12|nr:hypothetical protein [Parashewanella spongiae]
MSLCLTTESSRRIEAYCNNPTRLCRPMIVSVIKGFDRSKAYYYYIALHGKRVLTVSNSVSNFFENSPSPKHVKGLVNNKMC